MALAASCGLGQGCSTSAPWASDLQHGRELRGAACDCVSGVGRSDEFWPWMSHVLLPFVHGNQSSPELGPTRLRQVRLQEGELGPGLWGSLWHLSLIFSKEKPWAGFWVRVLYPLPASVSFCQGAHDICLQSCWEASGRLWSSAQVTGEQSVPLVCSCSLPGPLLSALCPDPPGTGAHTCSAAAGSFSTSDYGIGWGSAAHNSSETWAYSAPDLLG